MDKLPPHSPEAERALIGACLISPTVAVPMIQSALPDLNAFYEIKNRAIMERMFSQAPDAIDFITIRQWLFDTGNLERFGGEAFLGQCQDECVSPANAPEWIGIVSDKFTKRKVIAACSAAVMDAYGDSTATEMLERLETTVMKIRPQQRESGDIRFLVGEAINHIEYKFNNPDKMIGLPTGLMDLDKLTDGCHKGEMIIVAGLPSTGKTVLAVNIAVHNALTGEGAAIFSAEMRPVQLVVRSLCSNSRVNYHRLQSDENALGKMVNESAKLSSAPLYIEPSHGMTVGQVVAIARRLKSQKNIQIAVVDYLQLLDAAGDNREQQIANIAKGLKAMALELEIPVLVLSQVTDDGKLRESRAISQAADSVWKLENEGEWQPQIQPVNLRIEKCRDGETGKVSLNLMKTFTRFESVSVFNDEDVPQHWQQE